MSSRSRIRGLADVLVGAYVLVMTYVLALGTARGHFSVYIAVVVALGWVFIVWSVGHYARQRRGRRSD